LYLLQVSAGCWNRGSSVSILTRLWAHWLGSDSWYRQGFFSLPLHLDQLWNPPSLSSSRYLRVLPLG